ncbi:MAG: phosphopantothenoylcysteine decarboxylase [Deltaproteobacteria bacterium]|nr:phosphopantothenoylcysteine decarboxylase [Deltaproteobacteria bacterium]
MGAERTARATRPAELGLAVVAGPEAWRALGLSRRLLEGGHALHLALDPELERWVPRRSFHIACPGARLTPPERWPAVLAGRMVLGADAATLAALASGGGWLGPIASGAGRQAPLVLVEAGGPDPEPAWLAGPRRALAGAGHTFLPGGQDEAALVEALLGGLAALDLEGARVLITAGPSREYLDPVRFLSNPSSGRMGLALAAAARRRGARVELCLGPTALPVPAGIELHPFESAEELDALVQARAGEIDVMIAAAAVADWRPAERAPEKVKKSGERRSIEMVRTPDVLARLSAAVAGRGDRPFLVGFAAETERLVENARSKLERKGLDLVVANRVDGPEGAFAADDSVATLVDAQGETALPRQEKGRLAEAILDRVAAWWRDRA